MLSYGLSRLLDLENAHAYGLFSFFATLAVYNAQRLLKANDYKHTPWLVWVEINKKPLYFLVFSSLVAAGIILLFFFRLNWATFGCLALSGLVSILYVVHLGKRPNLREIPYLKIHLIALVWTGVLVLFPLMNEGYVSQLLPLCTAHYCYVFAVTIPFDIRDLKYDSPEQKTIPQVLGVQWAKILALGLMLAFTGIMMFTLPVLSTNPVFLLAVAVQVALIVFMNERRSDAYCAGGIDGAIAILGLSYLL